MTSQMTSRIQIELKMSCNKQPYLQLFFLSQVSTEGSKLQTTTNLWTKFLAGKLENDLRENLLFSGTFSLKNSAGRKNCEKHTIVFFCENLSSNNAPMWYHFVCSLKRENVGYCWKLSRVKKNYCKYWRWRWCWW